MLATFLTFAAELVEEEEPSKTLFYVMGIALACWAVLLFAIGMRSTAFPGSAGRAARRHRDQPPAGRRDDDGVDRHRIAPPVTAEAAPVA